MAGPLAYLIFLVPFGEFLTPALQDVNARADPGRPAPDRHPALRDGW
jgi:hypothetical protein